jgi:Zn-finger nucleic acid-binding protein
VIDEVHVSLGATFARSMIDVTFVRAPSLAITMGAVSYRAATKAVCPRCSEPLELARSATGGASVCRSCGGLFVVPAAVRALFDERASDLVRVADEAARAPPARIEPTECPCPICQSIMARVTVASIATTLDVCAAHGVWFDRWELHAVARAAKSGSGRTDALRQILGALGLA